jgi:hypothetical protein
MQTGVNAADFGGVDDNVTFRAAPQPEKALLADGKGIRPAASFQKPQGGLWQTGIPRWIHQIHLNVHHWVLKIWAQRCVPHL